MDNIKAINPESDSMVNDWHKKHKRHQARKTTPRTNSIYTGPMFLGCPNDMDCDGDVDTGGPDVDTGGTT